MRSTFTFALLLAICTFLSAAEQPTTAVSSAEFQVAEPREQTMAGFNFCYVSMRANVGTVKEAVGKLMPQLGKAMKDPATKTNGSVTFIFLGTPEDFELQVGTAVEEDAKAPDGFTIRKVPPFHCITTLYSGPLATFQEAYSVLMGKAFSGFQPLPEWREAYLYWEGDDSPNNVTHIQIGVQ